jgi:hypothetical protein
MKYKTIIFNYFVQFSSFYQVSFIFPNFTHNDETHMLNEAVSIISISVFYS